MMNFGHFETEMHLRYPDSLLFIRNMCDGGNTPGFRPHSSRVCLPGHFQELKNFRLNWPTIPDSQGILKQKTNGSPALKADIIIAFFGYNESFQGEEGLKLQGRVGCLYQTYPKPKI